MLPNAEQHPPRPSKHEYVLYVSACFCLHSRRVHVAATSTRTIYKCWIAYSAWISETPRAEDSQTTTPTPSNTVSCSYWGKTNTRNTFSYVKLMLACFASNTKLPHERSHVSYNLCVIILIRFLRLRLVTSLVEYEWSRNGIMLTLLSESCEIYRVNAGINSFSR